MRTVKLRMRPFAAMVMTARRWLDAHGVMPSVFHYDIGDEKMLVVRIQFAVDEKADVSLVYFAEQASVR
jgi:hypothetical protein